MTKEQVIEWAKLAGMELPEPIQRDDTEHGVDYYTADQLAAAVLAARNAALEEAAKKCKYLEVALDNEGNPFHRPADATVCASAIREMKENTL